VVLAAFALVGAFGAGSGIAGNPGSSCTVSTATLQPFLSFGDQDSYFLAPGGNFEGSPGKALNGWSTTGRVGIAKNNNESYYVGSPSDSQSLFMTAGSSATTPQICVSHDTPALRVFVQNDGTPNSSLAVLLNYTDQNGNAQTAQVASLSGGTSWSLSPHVRFLSTIAPLVGGQGQTSVSFSFVPTGGASWSIDDLYIDPIKSQGADGTGNGNGWGVGGCC
jgi:hypothetical protein